MEQKKIQHDLLLSHESWQTDISGAKKKTEENLRIFCLVILQANHVLFAILSQMAGIVAEILTSFYRSINLSVSLLLACGFGSYFYPGFRIRIIIPSNNKKVFGEMDGIFR